MMDSAEDGMTPTLGDVLTALGDNTQWHAGPGGEHDSLSEVRKY